jgi:glycosyltransferase involved in cell wall biosynthesis
LTISVVIRCHNEEAHIGRLLTGLLRQRRRPDEILVVDSGSTDATVSIAAAFGVEIVHIAPEDFSFGAACNVGVEAATGDAVVFVSAHAYPLYGSWLERLTAPLADPEVALSYGRQCGPSHARYSERRVFASWFPETSVPRQLDPFCNNANAAIRREVWETIRYDEQLTGLEDLDWAKRALAAGHVLAYVAEAEIVHVHDESAAQIRDRYRREAIAHRRIYGEQRMSAAAALRLAGANIASDYRAAARDGRLRENLADIPRFRIAQFLGTYQGFAQEGPVPALLRERFFYPDDPGTSPPGAPRGEQPIDYETPLDPAENW